MQLGFRAVSVDVFWRNVNVTVVPFECVGNVERLEQIQVMQGLEYGITIYQGQKVEDAFLPVIEQQEHFVPVNVFCTDNFFPHCYIMRHGFLFPPIPSATRKSARPFRAKTLQG